MSALLSDTLLNYLLSAADGGRFERVTQELLALRDGEAFVALGGMGDGGADGFLRGCFESKDQPGHFIQISLQENVSQKIRGTANRLKEVGRQAHSITHWSGTQVKEIDVLEEKLSKELGITIRIRDKLAFFRLTNRDKRTQELVQSYFRAEIFELTTQEKLLQGQNSDFVSDPTVFVFLQFETGERFSKGGLVTPIADALIYWALRDTDPEKNMLLARADLKKRITNLLPGADSNITPHLDNRLQALTEKSGTGTQRVRHYVDSDSFCLPYSMRIELAAASANEFTLKQQVKDSLRKRAEAVGAQKPEIVAQACENVIYKHFSQQGLLLAAFLENKLEGVTISDQVVEVELQAAAGQAKVPDAKTYGAALQVLRQVFYTPNAEEDEFLHRLSRTSMLLFSLKHAPKLIDYFNQLAGNFNLIVGTDILVKALSESFLPAQHRHVTNVLMTARKLGAKLYLTEPVMHEMYTHLHAAHREFINHYAAREQYITPSLASQCDRIFIRTYFYSRLHLNQVRGWNAFIDQFVDHDELDRNSQKGEQQLRGMLCKKFGLEFTSTADIEKGVDQEELNGLASELIKRNSFKHEELAKNDALMVLAVYARRKAGGEVAKYDGFGLRTWWLTKEYHVLAYTGNLVRKNGNVPYIMRPEFLLNFLTLAPNAAQDQAAQQLLPSHIGLQIGQHLPDAHMQRILQEIDNWKGLSAERIEIKISDTIDKLKFDRIKRYESNLELDSKGEADALIAALRTFAKK